jgi:general stress protein YciG
MGGKRKRGLAAMDPEKAREIQRLGGQTAQRLGTGHQFTHEEAREAGKKGQANARQRRAKAKDQNEKGQ